MIDAPNPGGIFLRSAFVLLTRGQLLDLPEIQKVGYPIRLGRQVPEIESGRMTTAMARGYC